MNWHRKFKIEGQERQEENSTEAKGIMCIVSERLRKTERSTRFCVLELTIEQELFSAKW